MQIYNLAIEENEMSIASVIADPATMIANAISLMQEQAKDNIAGIPDLCPHDLFSLFTANIIKAKLTFTR